MAEEIRDRIHILYILYRAFILTGEEKKVITGGKQKKKKNKSEKHIFRHLNKYCQTCVRGSSAVCAQQQYDIL